jgi:hypothetical protein
MTHEHNKPMLPSWLMDYIAEKALTETAYDPKPETA